MVEAFFLAVVAAIFTYATARGLRTGGFQNRAGRRLVERRGRPVEYWLVMGAFLAASLLAWGFALDRAFRHR
jgi:hypothetical protein